MATAVAVAGPAGRFGNLRHTALSAFWFGNFFMWQPLTTVVIQNQIDAVVPKANQGTAIGLAVSVGGLFAMTIPPIVGAISDRLNTPFGRRRPVMVGATLLTLPGLLILATASSYPQIIIGYAWCEFFRPMLGGDFAWVILTRFFVSAGITAVAYYLNNFFRDVVNVSDPGTFTSEWFLVVLLVAIPFGLAGGYFSDRLHRRKMFVYA